MCLPQDTNSPSIKFCSTSVIISFTLAHNARTGYGEYSGNILQSDSRLKIHERKREMFTRKIIYCLIKRARVSNKFERGGKGMLRKAARPGTVDLSSEYYSITCIHLRVNC